MGDEAIENKRRKRKKRINFLANAKKYAKKGRMGRGCQMPEDLYQYFVGILEAIKQGIDDVDQKVALVNNVLERTKGEELNVVGNQLGCRIIEQLLPYSSAEDIERFIEILSPELRRLCSDDFASHVIETLIRVCSDRATKHLNSEDNTETEYTEDHIRKCNEFTIKLSKYAINNLEDFVWDQYANHILRSVLKSLSGIVLLPGEKPKVSIFRIAVGPNKGIPPGLATIEYKNVPEDYKDIVKEFAHRLSSWPQFKDLPYENLTSGLLQVLLYAVKNVDKGVTKDLIKKLLTESFTPDDWVENDGNDEKGESKEKMDSGGSLPPVFTSESAVRLLEAALFVANKKMYTQIYAKCFINRLAQLSTMQMLNFTVQRLIDNCQIKEEFEPIFDELANKFGDILECGNSGVIVALAKACQRIKARQMQFLTSLETALGITEEHQKYFSVLCLKQQPIDKVDLSAIEKPYFIQVHGSVILQSILDFQRPAKAVNSLLELSPEALVVMMSDAKGSHVADALCKGQCVGVKARDKLIWKLKGYYQKLALSQHGSRAFEAIFKSASPEQKVKIMSEISDKSNLLNSTQYGKLIAAKYDLNTFKTSQTKWEESWQKKEKANKE